jgi:hypothetical protein
VNAVVGQLVGQWRQEQQIEKVLIEARDRMLPSAALGSGGVVTDWQIRALRAAGAAIDELRDRAPVEELRAAAVRGVESVTKAFEVHRIVLRLLRDRSPICADQNHRATGQSGIS